MTEIDLAQGDWRGKGAPRDIRVQVYKVTRSAPPTGDDWVWLDGWRFPDHLAPSPDPVRLLARWSALPPDVRAMLMVDEAVADARP